MAQRTCNAIIVDAISMGLGLPRTNIQNDVIAEAVARYNHCAKTIYEMWPWDNRKADQFTTADATYVGSFASGVITFTSIVDQVLAVKAVSTDSDLYDTFIWPQSEVNAAMLGQDVSSSRFTILADTSAGLRRIKVNTDDAVTVYKVLATLRFVDATIESTYDAATPSATPTDYRVVQFLIDHANQALVSFVADELRAWDGQKRENDWERLLQVAINKVNAQSARHSQIMPHDSDVVGLMGETWGF